MPLLQIGDLAKIKRGISLFKALWNLITIMVRHEGLRVHCVSAVFAFTGSDRQAKNSIPCCFLNARRPFGFEPLMLTKDRNKTPTKVSVLFLW